MAQPMDDFDIDEDASDIETEELPPGQWHPDDGDGDETSDDGIDWTEIKPDRQRTPARNKPRIAAGLTSRSMDANTPLKSFKLFPSDKLLGVILDHTNRRLLDENLAQMDADELMAFLATLIAMGFTKQTTVNSYSFRNITTNLTQYRFYET